MLDTGCEGRFAGLGLVLPAVLTPLGAGLLPWVSPLLMTTGVAAMLGCWFTSSAILMPVEGL